MLLIYKCGSWKCKWRNNFSACIFWLVHNQNLEVEMMCLTASISWKFPRRFHLLQDLHFPKSLQDLHALVSLTASYKQDHWYYVLLLFCSAYIYKQTFAIPGSALLVRIRIIIAIFLYNIIVYDKLCCRWNTRLLNVYISYLLKKETKENAKVSIPSLSWGKGSRFYFSIRRGELEDGGE